MKRCTRCVLPETFPGVRFDDEGVCHFCRQDLSPEREAGQKERLLHRFEDLVRRVRPRSTYHCLVSWSGGKDSTYTLWLLRNRYKLRILAFTFDNGFVSPAAFQNIRTVAENLKIDHMIVKPRFDILRKVFLASMDPSMYPLRALERASGICNSCMALAKGIALQIALGQEIPILAYGWSPGQIPLASAYFRTNHAILKAMNETAKAPLEKVAGRQIDVYFPRESRLERMESPPSIVAPLAFLSYSEKEALQRIRKLGWERPKDTDPNSTNCLLNSLSIVTHTEQHGYHPYAMELSGLVRRGCMTRVEAIERLQAEPQREILAAAKAKLGLPLSEPGR